jgi:hypothetical protein
VDHVFIRSHGFPSGHIGNITVQVVYYSALRGK